MRLRYVPIVLLLVCLASAFAQITKDPQPSVQRDKQAIDVLSTITSQLSLAPALSTVASGTITMWDGKSGRITVKSLGFDQVRYDLDLDGKGSTFAIGRSGSTSTIDGAKKPLPLWVAQYVGPEHIPTLSRVNDYTQSDRSVIYVGLEKFRDTEVHHIKLFRFEPDPQLTKIVEIMSEFHVFVEAKTGLVLKIQTNIFSPETPTNSSVVENVYSDFRMISNVPVPFHMVRKVDGQEQSDIAFDTVSFDTINTAADFQ